jgi:hypothetical protein
VCRYAGCSQKSTAFSSAPDRDKHEQAHLPSLSCTHTGCHYPGRFRTPAQLRKHVDRYHSTANAVLPRFKALDRGLGTDNETADQDVPSPSSTQAQRGPSITLDASRPNNRPVLTIGDLAFCRHNIRNFKPRENEELEGEGILCRVTSVIGEGKQRRYEIQDTDTTESFPPQRASVAQLIPIPVSNKGLTDMRKDMTVIAQYPETTTFYKAEVCEAWRGVPEEADSEPDFVRLVFEGGREIKMVNRRFVLSGETSEKNAEDRGTSGSSRPANKSTKALSSYWSSSEQQDFRRYVAHFGTDFAAISAHMGTKSATMIKNHYQRQVDGGDQDGLRESAATADKWRERGEYVGPPPTPTPIVKRKYDNIDPGPDFYQAALKADERREREEDMGPPPIPSPAQQKNELDGLGKKESTSHLPDTQSQDMSEQDILRPEQIDSYCVSKETREKYKHALSQLYSSYDQALPGSADRQEL